MAEIMSLSNLHVVEISLVDKGANLRKPFPVSKAKGNPSIKGDGTMEANDVKFEEVQKQLVSQTSELIEVRKANEANKAALESVQKSFDALTKENVEINKALKASNDARDLDQWVSKAKIELSHFPGKNAEDLGRMLKTLNDVSPEMGKVQFEAMKSVSEAMKGSSVLKEAGKDNASDTTGSALYEIGKISEGLVAKNTAGLTKSQAFVQTIRANPTLYQHYLNENPKQCGK